MSDGPEMQVTTQIGVASPLSLATTLRDMADDGDSPLNTMDRKAFFEMASKLDNIQPTLESAAAMINSVTDLQTDDADSSMAVGALTFAMVVTTLTELEEDDV